MVADVQKFVTVCIGCSYVYTYRCLIDENCIKTLHCSVYFGHMMYDVENHQVAGMFVLF